MITTINEYKKLNENYNNLISKITNFLDTHAKLSANYDPEYDDEDDMYNGPDPSMIKATIYYISNNLRIPFSVNSSWGSGCYEPYNSKTAKSLHDEILDDIKKYNINHD